MSTSSNPSDFRIIEQIYDDYIDEFEQTADSTAEGGEKVYVEIDIVALAEKLKVNKHVLFGRLYYHLDKKHRYKDEETGAWTHLFARVLADKRHCIHFPYLSALVAEQQRDMRRFLIPLFASWIVASIALFLSFVGLVRR